MRFNLRKTVDNTYLGQNMMNGVLEPVLNPSTNLYHQILCTELQCVYHREGKRGGVLPPLTINSPRSHSNFA
ncbi:hypothetical protein Y032_0431g1333 [Ancylostoma ceylanicum]|uniref:Uncharacterized protein n=1 Tax=Ancylostoma ceylanicum TaxID=53326 RepID=A0A016X265_9BILA|nr:hypothetical protein Y032_0431g1333 [Ancylostoma ceylanicum]